MVWSSRECNGGGIKVELLIASSLSQPDEVAIVDDSPVIMPVLVEQEEDHESPKQRPADLRELQDRPPKGHRAGDLHEYQAQAETRIKSMQ